MVCFEKQNTQKNFKLNGYGKITSFTLNRYDLSLFIKPFALRTATLYAIGFKHHPIWRFSIFSLIACDVGASIVYACEKSHAMYEVARDVLQANFADDRVLLFHQSSTDLAVPDDLSERYSIKVHHIRRGNRDNLGIISLLFA